MDPPPLFFKGVFVTPYHFQTVVYFQSNCVLYGHVRICMRWVDNGAVLKLNGAFYVGSAAVPSGRPNSLSTKGTRTTPSAWPS